MTSERPVSGGPRHCSVPRRSVRLRSSTLDHEAGHGGAEETAMKKVVATHEARVEPRAVCVPRARHVLDSPRTQRWDALRALVRVDCAPPRAPREDDDAHEVEEVLRPLPAGKREGSLHLRLVAEENLRTNVPQPDPPRGDIPR